MWSFLHYTHYTVVFSVNSSHTVVFSVNSSHTVVFSMNSSHTVVFSVNSSHTVVFSVNSSHTCFLREQQPHLFSPWTAATLLFPPWTAATLVFSVNSSHTCFLREQQPHLFSPWTAATLVFSVNSSHTFFLCEQQPHCCFLREIQLPWKRGFVIVKFFTGALPSLTQATHWDSHTLTRVAVPICGRPAFILRDAVWNLTRDRRTATSWSRIWSSPSFTISFQSISWKLTSSDANCCLGDVLQASPTTLIWGCWPCSASTQSTSCPGWTGSKLASRGWSASLSCCTTSSSFQVTYPPNRRLPVPSHEPFLALVQRMLVLWFGLNFALGYWMLIFVLRLTYLLLDLLATFHVTPFSYPCALFWAAEMVGSINMASECCSIASWTSFHSVVLEICGKCTLVPPYVLGLSHQQGYASREHFYSLMSPVCCQSKYAVLIGMLRNFMKLIGMPPKFMGWIGML